MVKIPKRAGLYSAILPGAGQVYTKKYWKVPIIYAGLITSAYYIKESHDLYDLYKQTYLNRLAGTPTGNSPIKAEGCAPTGLKYLNDKAWSCPLVRVV